MGKRNGGQKNLCYLEEGGGKAERRLKRGGERWREMFELVNFKWEMV